MAIKFNNGKILNLSVQQLGLQRFIPGSSCCVLNGCLTWEGRLQPTPLSRIYEVNLVYRLKKVPKIYVIDPPLQKRAGKHAPHIYDDESLCVYYPPANEWRPSMLLAHTVLPWASEWLMHYELWLATGDWYGGGIH